MKFELKSEYKPKGDQPKAITELTKGLKDKKKFQVLLGATGTGKTYTIANVIQNIGKKTLVLAHNKTLAGQLYSEFKSLFPNNKVEYFISNFDFYQPEAYLPRSDTFIDKTAQSNEEIEMMRLSALNALAFHDDVIVVASVASIYGEFDPTEYKKLFFEIQVGEKISKQELLRKLVKVGYKRNEMDLKPGVFRSKGDVLEISLGWTNEFFLRISFFGDEIEEIATVDVLENKVISKLKHYPIAPADDYIASGDRLKISIQRIKEELKERIKFFKSKDKLLEAQRIEQRTVQDMEMLSEFGVVSGIENYSRHIELREAGQPPFTLIDYFGKDWLLVVDESHIMLPQVKGMYNTDVSRKTTLVEYGFRLPSALDNRPLNFDEFMGKINQAIFVSATPGDLELGYVNNKSVEQIIRPTGLVDPIVNIKSNEGQIEDIIANVKKAIQRKERSLITTMTKRMAEDLSTYLKEKGVKVTYLHSELKTLERNKVINDLRKGIYDVLVGINLLREGIDLPEVSFIAIIDADKDGFLRNARSLIQIIGRAARNVNGTVNMYARKTTESMKSAISETTRRRNIQLEYNKKNNITPKTIVKPIREIQDKYLKGEIENYIKKSSKKSTKAKHEILNKLRTEMLVEAKKQNYERAAEIRDIIMELEAE